ncbi:MAG TPA: carboxypeptidase-like regulatory domain-containing protein [Candidatus Dormibacteraeota bacterium]|nr:carboxypeptidase-like regulatory domain-containing protein [Candidatus Dormibacteraeota bacterium]
MKTVSCARRPAVLIFLLAMALGVPCAAQSGSAKGKAQDKKSDDGTTLLLIHVVGGEKPDAVTNASVYLHLQEKSAILFLLRKHKKVELDLKTDNNGYASFPGLPRGKVLIQVVAAGWKPFGEYYLVNQPNQTIQIKLQRPKTHWY